MHDWGGEKLVLKQQKQPDHELNICATKNQRKRGSCGLWMFPSSIRNQE